MGFCLKSAYVGLTLRFWEQPCFVYKHGLNTHEELIGYHSHKYLLCLFTTASAMTIRVGLS